MSNQLFCTAWGTLTSHWIQIGADVFLIETPRSPVHLKKIGLTLKERNRLTNSFMQYLNFFSFSYSWLESALSIPYFSHLFPHFTHQSITIGVFVLKLSILSFASKIFKALWLHIGQRKILKGRDRARRQDPWSLSLLYSHSPSLFGLFWGMW